MKGSKKHLKAWWQPIVEMKFDDPEQEAPFWTGSSNNVALNTPFPGIQIRHSPSSVRRSACSCPGHDAPISFWHI